MKTFTALFLLGISLALSASASAGQIIYKNMYSGNLAQGTGSDLGRAKKDAELIIPSGMVQDPANSPASECLSPKTGSAKINDKGRCEAPDGLVLYTVPLIKKN